jgi:hypothetical protein
MGETTSDGAPNKPLVLFDPAWITTGDLATFTSNSQIEPPDLVVPFPDPDCRSLAGSILARFHGVAGRSPGRQSPQ